MKSTKHIFLRSLLALLLCFSMLLGSTYAWFTDSVSSVNNIIKAGSLDIAMYWNEDLTGAWKNVEEENKIFDYDKWEPGYTEVRYVKIVNEGDLAFKYAMSILPMGAVSILANVIDVYYVENPPAPITDRTTLPTRVGTLAQAIAGQLPASGTMTAKGQEVVVGIALKMQETAGNEYQGLSIGDSFSIQLMASQLAYEEDSFGKDYDAVPGGSNAGGTYTATSSVDTNANNEVIAATGLSSTNGEVSAVVPEGVKTTGSQLELSVKPVEESQANVTVGEDENAFSLDVHIEGVAADNTKPIAVTLAGYLPTGLNLGNHKLYHVEDGQTVEMTYLAEGATPVHNNYTYDPATGDVTLYLSSFSEIAVTSKNTSTWTGGVDYSWYDPAQTRLTISNADQLEAFARLVGGMAKDSAGNDIYPRDSFAGKVVKLACDVDLGWTGIEEGYTPFKPIGYYFSVDADGKSNAYSTIYSFEGVFDGGGNTVKNFYQNTWAISGDYNSGYPANSNYYKDGFGLFGYVVNGTVKNLTVENFSSDGEFTPTGVIAAYAVNSTFENINLVDCNPRVYNTGNGGIVGIGGNDDDPESYKLTFKNITIDNSNKITALWGSWDVACGGLVGMFRGAGHVYMTNCHVAAQIDVFNDVCGNYQYYWYRYAGMLVGTNKTMIEVEGYTVPETSKYHAENCTVHFGDWNDYYYCELVANSLASYTHDHQFSRLEPIASLEDIQDENGWKKTGNFLLINGEEKTCYHIVNKDGTLAQHNHADSGYEDGIDEDGNGENDLKEDKQIVYLPFNQLFTGYGWGVKHIPLGEFDGVTIYGREAAPIEKFVGTGEATVDCGEIALGTLFAAIGNEDVEIKPGSLHVGVQNLEANGTVTATLTRDTSDWTKSVLRFSGTGRIALTIQDYYYCVPTTVELTVRGHQNTATFVDRVAKKDDPNGIGYELWACTSCNEAVKIAANHEDGHCFVGGTCKCGATETLSDRILVASHKFETATSGKNLALSFAEAMTIEDGRWNLAQSDHEAYPNYEVQHAIGKADHGKITRMMGGELDGKAVSKIYISFELSHSGDLSYQTDPGKQNLFSVRSTAKDGTSQHYELHLYTTVENDGLTLWGDANGDGNYTDKYELTENETYTVTVEMDPFTNEYALRVSGGQWTEAVTLESGTTDYPVADYRTTVFHANSYKNFTGSIYIDNLAIEARTRTAAGGAEVPTHTWVADAIEGEVGLYTYTCPDCSHFYTGAGDLRATTERVKHTFDDQMSESEWLYISSVSGGNLALTLEDGAWRMNKGTTWHYVAYPRAGTKNNAEFIQSLTGVDSKGNKVDGVELSFDFKFTGSFDALGANAGSGLALMLYQARKEDNSNVDIFYLRFDQGEDGNAVLYRNVNDSVSIVNGKTYTVTLRFEPKTNRISAYVENETGVRATVFSEVMKNDISHFGQIILGREGYKPIVEGKDLAIYIDNMTLSTYVVK